jgi:hypothetical protein
MPIIYKGRDITHLVTGGTNVRTKNIHAPVGLAIRGSPDGDHPSCDWERSNSFGITIGNIDLGHFYKPTYTDFYNDADVNLPEGVNAVKVFCIGGGGGGAGGNGGHRNWNRERGNYVASWNGGYYNRYTRYDAPSNGNNGAFGNYGQHAMGHYGRDANIFRVRIGNGGHGGNGGYQQDGPSGTSGNSGGSGNATQFTIGGSTLTAHGGNGGHGTTGNRYGNTTNPAYNAPPGTPPYSSNGGNGGRTSTWHGEQGGGGNRGFCRVYYLY